MKKTLIPFGIALPLVASAAGAAHADQGSTVLQATLAALNGSGASGSATVAVSGDKVTVEIDSHGLVANSPHAQHFHIGGMNTCPTVDADDNGDGRISTSEGAPAYGPINVSLTTRGDTSIDSALATDRMPSAGDDGKLSYSRTIEVSDDVLTKLRAGKAVIVQHGVDYNGNGKYDGKAKSDVDARLPAEATDPAVCGKLLPVPVDGVQAGGGGTSGDNRVLLGLGCAALLAATAGGAFIRRARRER